ncbi:N-acetylglucosaminyl-diphospho-decaprenol L-rhamnosyltransferase [Thermincola ferriacetica]|uniref:N-acetylglucosaminyl-diphospho-decaprenol L-rhamnosyltransferase n=1 Tax=Thermincola ferriacetica TaxID=281456 RepID=A0A0L6W4M1_9FIRM|nr:glycosyltransferase family 2 protein [Thermincola ferriacetica]KNZ70049.1 N-acetylglucosaminyl-diphospho-decaprenol L-rhamnosyltransferase [Thermincola ferriacetica]
MNKVYIIVLNWNGWQDTVECVESCQKLTYPNFRILIVDNGSSDGSEAILRNRFPDIEFIQTGANLGYAGGNNIGIRYALAHGADYIWLLNNDTTVTPDALTALVDVAEKNPQVGIGGSKIYFYNKPKTLWFAGGHIDFHSGETLHMGMGDLDTGQFDYRREVDYITGCSLLARRNLIETIGLMDEEYFLYFEETAWCVKASLAGYKVVFVPESVIYHKESGSTGARSPLFYYYMTRNRLYFLKNFGRKVKWLKRFYSDFRGIAQFIKNDPCWGQKTRAITQGYLDFFRGRMGQRK